MHVILYLVALCAVGCTFCVQGAVGAESTEGANSDVDPKFLETIDEMIKHGDTWKFREAQRLLLEKCGEPCKDPELLWRVASCSAYLLKENKNLAVDVKMDLAEEGYKYAEDAVKYGEKNADAHKVLAVLAGEKGRMGPLWSQVAGAKEFKEHLDIALNLNPNDPYLVHLLAVFQFEIGKLHWIVRSSANALVGELFNDIDLDGALRNFEKAAEMRGEPWKMNYLYRSKCYYYKLDYPAAQKWVKRAKSVESKNYEDEQADKAMAEYLIEAEPYFP